MKNGQLTTPFVGRESELAQLHSWFKKALNGERQIVFVSGEAGIGKTSLVEAFLFGVRSYEEFGVHKAKLRTLNTELPSTPSPWIGRGQCVEHYGVGEAYLPVLEALGRLCRAVDGQEVIALLRHQAPTWLVQMPAVVSPAELEELQRRTAGVTRERMLRELAEALEVVTQERPLALVFEDLHWSDVSTLDLLSILARRQEPARLLIIGTYRPVEVLTRDHPLKGIKPELQLHGQCEELALDFLTEEDVAEYLAARFNVPSPLAGEGQDGGALRSRPGHQPPLPGPLPRGEREPIAAGSVHKLAHFIHRRTDGNPLFMVNVTNELVAREIVTNRDGQWEIQDALAGDNIGVPENLRQLIEQQLARVNPDERKILEAASVAGAEFSAAAVAAGAEQTTEAVETHCDDLVRREQFLRAQGTSEWPDGTVATSYGFVHALYQEVVYDQLSTTRRSRLHRQIGEREEQGYGDRAREIAAALAVHFEQGRDYRRAIQYLQYAGENAVRRSANVEATAHLSKGLELLKILPDTPERTRQELALQIALGTPLVATKGYAAPEVEKAYTRARELCQQIGETSQLFPVLRGLWAFYYIRAELMTACELGEQCLTLAQRTQDLALLAEAHYTLGATALYLGEVISARGHAEQGIALYDLQQHRSHAFLYGHDPGVACLSYAALALWNLGYPDQALKRSRQAFALAQELSHPNSLAFALSFAASLHFMRGEGQLVQEYTEALITLSTEQEFPHWLALGIMQRGLVLVRQGQAKEGITQMRQGMDADRATGAELPRVGILPGLAWAYGQTRQIEEGLHVVAEAFTDMKKTGVHISEVGLYVTKGWLLLALSAENHIETEACFQRAIAIARRQSAKSLELRATVSLARLWQRQGKEAEARTMLSTIYHWFTEGFDTKDLQEAKALLAELSGHREI